MKTNIEKAVGIIAVLSLFLGLSLGRIQQQQKEIQQLKSQHYSSSFEFPTLIIADSPWADAIERKTLERVELKLRETEMNLRQFQCRLRKRSHSQ